MITNEGSGWAKVSIGDFVGHASYIIEETPLQFLKAVFQVVRFGDPFTVECDEEGSEFLVTFTKWQTYIIHCTEGYQLYVFDTDIRELADELLRDIEGKEKEWAESFSVDDGDVEHLEQSLQKWCKYLRIALEGDVL